MLAITNRFTIEIYSFVTLAVFAKFDGHADQISCFAWKDNDTRLISCDTRGVICEWDLIKHCKLWENTAVLSYSSTAVTSNGRHVLAVGSPRVFRCLSDALVAWEVDISEELTTIVVSSSNVIYIGTSTGCLKIFTFEESEACKVYELQTHSGNVTEVKLCFNGGFLFSSGSDGCVFSWKTKELCEEAGFQFSNLALVSREDIDEQKEKLLNLRMSLQYTNTACDYEMQLSAIRHDKEMEENYMQHELAIDALNDKIALIKEDIQTILFDSEPRQDLHDLETATRKRMIESTLQLNKSYERSNAYAEETKKIIKNYETIIESLGKDLAMYSSDYTKREEIMGNIKRLEDTLSIEKNVTRQIKSTLEECRQRTQKEMSDDVENLTDFQRNLLETEKLKSMKLKEETERVWKMVHFQRNDSHSKRNVTSGCVDYEMKEKFRAVSVLKKDFQKLDNLLETKEKIIQNQELKFFDSRKLVGNLQRSFSVSKNTIEELKADILSKESKINSCKIEINEISDSIPALEEEIKIMEDLCSTVTEKLQETVEGFQEKQKFLRDIQDIIAKYSVLLSHCILKDCNPEELRQNILNLFEEGKKEGVEEAMDADRRAEFTYQVQRLENIYADIKGEPAKAMKDKAVAEFRLSQENSNLLHEVHKVQKDIEKLRVVTTGMEIAMGMPLITEARALKETEELRNRIEFVIHTIRKERRKKAEEISKLDKFIEEQQKEMERFQTMLAAKLRRPKQKLVLD